jgi:hypothetical protein
VTGYEFDADGSLKLYIQGTPQEESKKNKWLPAPKENVLAIHKMLLAG